MTTPNTPVSTKPAETVLPQHFATICDDGHWIVNKLGPHGYNHVNAGWPSKKVYTEDQVRQILATPAPSVPLGGGEVLKKGLSVKDAMRCGICGESGVHYHTNHPDDETTTRRPVAHPFEVTDEIVEIVAREMERHSTADYEWTPEQFAIWWEKDEYCKREKVRAKARAGLLALSASPPPAPQREPLTESIREFIGEVADDTALNSALRDWAKRILADFPQSMPAARRTLPLTPEQIKQAIHRDPTALTQGLVTAMARPC